MITLLDMLCNTLPSIGFVCYRIDHDGKVKVSDFGLTRRLYHEKVYFRQKETDGVKLPIKWMALESIEDGIFSEKSDVVS